MSVEGRETAYVPGPHVAIAGPHLQFFGDLDPSGPVVSRLWELFRTSADPAAVIPVIEGEWPSQLRDFAVVSWTSGRSVVTLAGRMRADVELVAGTENLACPSGVGLATFRLNDAPQQVVLVAGHANPSLQSLLPLAGGVVAASALVVRATLAVPAAAAASDVAPEPVVAAGSVEASPEPPPVPIRPTETGESDVGSDPASAIEVELAAEEVSAPAAAAEPALEAPAAAAQPAASPEPVAAAEPPAPLAPQPAVCEDTILPGDTITGPGLDETGPAEPPAAEEPDQNEPPEPPEAGAPFDEAPTDSYDHLFGMTINRSVEEAAIRAAEGASVLPASPVPASQPADPPAPGSSPAPTRLVGAMPAPRDEPLPAGRAAASFDADAAVAPFRPPTVAPTTGMIESVPWMSPSPGPTATTPASPPAPTSPAPTAPAGSRTGAPSDEDANEMTIQRGAHEALLRQMSSPGNLGPPGPSVHAVRCQANHLNPPHLATCRVCRAPIEQQSPVTVPRPVLGLLRLSTGDDIVLDRSVLIGRSPSVDRLVGGERPHVVKLPSPGQDISRNHVEVRLDDWHILVTDLNSTNGTVIARPGAPPERLRPNDPAMIEPGTVVTIADEVSFTYEATS